jgi:hypothetical protein
MIEKRRGVSPPEGVPVMDPVEALKYVQTLVRLAQRSADLPTVFRLLEEMNALICKALEKPSSGSKESV